MEQNNCDDIIKKTVYLFKKYAREKGFWEEYKRLSNPLNYKNHPRTFLQIVKDNEPVKLIQNTSVFCSWPSICTFNGLYWSKLSADWVRICVKEKLYWNKKACFKYIDMSIFMSRSEKLKLLGDYYNY